MGTGSEPGIFLLKKICRRQPANSFFRIASESEKVFERILDDFLRCFDLPKISVFSGQTIQNFKSLTPPLYFEIKDNFILFQKKFLDGDRQH